MARLWNCKCLYDYDQEVLLEALVYFIALQENRLLRHPELTGVKGKFDSVERAIDLHHYIKETPLCPSENPKFTDCIERELPEDRSLLAKKTFLVAAKKCGLRHGIGEENAN